MTMNKLRIVFSLLVACFFGACTAEEEYEMTDNTSIVDTAKVKAVDYIPPNTNESSIGDTKRKRKFYIR